MERLYKNNLEEYSQLLVSDTLIGNHYAVTDGEYSLTSSCLERNPTAYRHIHPLPEYDKPFRTADTKYVHATTDSLRYLAYMLSAGG